MLRRLLAALVLLASLAFSTAAQAATETFHVVNEAQIPAAPLAEAEHAVAEQINTQVSRHWALPHMRFADSGIPVYMVRDAQLVAMCGPGAGGCHSFDGAGNPYEVVGQSSGIEGSSGIASTLSHETIETAIDPTSQTVIDGTLAEACDPVASDIYPLDGQWVSDFVYPRYFVAGSSGPWDHFDVVHAALNVAAFGDADPTTA